MNIKKYCKENIYIKVTGFELRDVSFYGCDACFEFEIRDKETDVLLDKDYETVENAFMGVDDSEDIYYFLEEKGIDFSEEYDDDFDKLPDNIKKEFEEYELNLYDESYHEWFFEDGDTVAEGEQVEKIMKSLYLDRNLLYIIKGDNVEWIEIDYDYYGVHLKSETVKINRVYNIDMEGWIFEVDGVYFNVCSYDVGSNFALELYKRDDEHPCVVTDEDLKNENYWGYNGKAGDVIYNYYVPWLRTSLTLLYQEFVDTFVSGVR